MSALQVIRRAFNGAERELLQDSETGSLYMTSEQIGLALGYAEPAANIRKVYERHHDELRAFREDVKLSREVGPARLTTIWRKEALYLFAMFARTETAKEFRLWVTATCRELESGDKILVSRGELEAYTANVARLGASAAEMFRSLASIHGSSLARLGALKKRSPELFGHDVGQRFFEFAQADEPEAIEDGGE